MLVFFKALNTNKWLCYNNNNKNRLQEKDYFSYLKSQECDQSI